jgi:threonine/homoserine/homoserine lactone efflux protein
MTSDHVAGFAVAVVPIMLTPGVSVTLATQRTLRDGPSAGLRVAAGTACGLAVHATTAAVGVAGLVAESATAYTALKLAGAAYLVVLGVALLRGGRRAEARRLPWTGHGPFRQALLGNVLNPRAASVYLTLVPQFVGPHDDVLAATALLAGVHIAMQTAWLATCTLAVARAHRALGGRRLRRRAQALAGSVLVGLGLRTALQGHAS